MGQRCLYRSTTGEISAAIAFDERRHGRTRFTAAMALTNLTGVEFDRSKVEAAGVHALIVPWPWCQIRAATQGPSYQTGERINTRRTQHALHMPAPPEKTAPRATSQL